MTENYEKILTDSYLSKDQSKIYTFLLENGLSNAKIISSKTGIGRALTYKVIEQLVGIGLVEKRENIGKIASFFPVHPQKIKDLVSNKKHDMDIAAQGLDAIFSSLTSSYNVLLGKPNVQSFDGADGLKRVYEDILDHGKDIRVISSPINDGRKDVLHLIREQVEKQVALKIRTKAITPIKDQSLATPISDDEKYLITRKAIPAEKLNIPAQIIIYGDKVAITSFKENMITVVIESKYIHETFSTLFEYVWNQGA